MKTGFSNRMKDVFTFVREEVIRLGHSSIKVEHLFLGILRDGGGSAIKVLKNLDVEPADLKTIIENTIKNNLVHNNVRSNEISFSKQAERVLWCQSIRSKVSTVALSDPLWRPHGF